MRKVPVKLYLRRKIKGGVAVIPTHSTTVKDKKAKKHTPRKTAYSNEVYDVFNVQGRFKIVEKSSGKTVAVSDKPSVVKEFVGKGADDFFGKQVFKERKRVAKYKTRNVKKGKSIRGAVERANVKVNTGEAKVGRQKGLPNRITKAISKPARRILPRRLKRLGTPARRIEKKSKNIIPITLHEAHTKERPKK